MSYHLAPWKPLDHAPLRNPLVPNVRITAGRSRGFLEPYPYTYIYIYIYRYSFFLFWWIFKVHMQYRYQYIWWIFKVHYDWEGSQPKVKADLHYLHVIYAYNAQLSAMPRDIQDCQDELWEQVPGHALHIFSAIVFLVCVCTSAPQVGSISTLQVFFGYGIP